MTKFDEVMDRVVTFCASSIADRFDKNQYIDAIARENFEVPHLGVALILKELQVNHSSVYAAL